MGKFWLVISYPVSAAFLSKSWYSISLVALAPCNRHWIAPALCNSLCMEPALPNHPFNTWLFPIWSPGQSCARNIWHCIPFTSTLNHSTRGYSNQSTSLNEDWLLIWSCGSVVSKCLFERLFLFFSLHSVTLPSYWPSDLPIYLDVNSLTSLSLVFLFLSKTTNTLLQLYTTTVFLTHGIWIRAPFLLSRCLACMHLGTCCWPFIYFLHRHNDFNTSAPPSTI